MRIVPAKRSNSLPESLNLAPFQGIPFREQDSMKRAYQQILNRSYPRTELVSLLDRYNRDLGNDEAANYNIARLADQGMGCVVTGQQLGLMGGPSYTILKGISCLLQAREIGAVPIFWLATEDHDVVEIDHATLLDSYGNFNNFRLSLPKDGSPVEDLKLFEKNRAVIEQFLQTAMIDKTDRPIICDSYARTMAQVMVKLFAGTGMVFLEPKLLRPLARPFFRREIEECVHLKQILQQTTKQLVSSGGQAVISFKNGTNLFLKSEEGERHSIHFSEGSFTAGKINYTKKELLSLIDEQPERFSPNVAARPVMQGLLIPTVSYCAGPSECLYYQQLGDYHLEHGVPMPCITPRLSATLIPKHAAEILEKCNIDPTKSFSSHWMDLLPGIGEEISLMQGEWQQSAASHFGKEAGSQQLDRLVKLGVKKLQNKMLKIQLQKRGIPTYGLHLLHNLIYPHHKNQERVLNWWSFQSYSSENLIMEMLKLPTWRQESHLTCYL